MSEDLKTTNETRPNETRPNQTRSNGTRSIARQLARELHPEELDVVAAGCGCPNSSTFCGDHDYPN